MTTKTFGPSFDLFSMTGLTGGWAALASAGAATAHVLAWPYTAMVLGVTAAYRLLAERARRKAEISAAVLRVLRR